MKQQVYPQILCFGEPMVELVRNGGEDSDTYTAGVGGDMSNAAIAAARQGGSASVLTALGQDRFGDRVLRVWEREGVDASAMVRNADAPTGMYIIDPDPAERHYTYFRSGSAASRFRAQDLPSEHLANAAILHVSGITLAVSEAMRASAFEAMRQVRAAGGQVSFDTNLRLKLWDAETARQVTEQAAKLASILVTSTDDSATLTGSTDPDAILAHYAAFGCRIIIVTRGAEGAVLRADGETREVPPAAANPVDSTGAGDSFSGAFLAWWQETGDPWIAARLAAVVAAGTVSGLGAVDPIPHRTAVLATAAKLGITL